MKLKFNKIDKMKKSNYIIMLFVVVFTTSLSSCSEDNITPDNDNLSKDDNSINNDFNLIGTWKTIKTETDVFIRSEDGKYDYDREDAAYTESDYRWSKFIAVTEFQFFESGNMRVRELRTYGKDTYTRYSELLPYAIKFDSDSLLIYDSEYHIYSSDQNDEFVLRIAGQNEAEDLDEYPRRCDYVFLERVN